MCYRNRAIVLLGLFFVLAGCGQKGALYLPTIEPDEAITKVEEDAQLDATVESE